MGFADGQGSNAAVRVRLEGGGAAPRLTPDQRVRRRLATGIGVSLLLHALVLSLRFGVPGLGGSAGSQPISVRIAASEPAPSVAPPPEAPLPPLPPLLPLPEPPKPAPVTGMRLIPPRPLAPPVVAQVAPAPVAKPVKPRKARRVSSPMPRAPFEEPPRLIAQDAEPNDFMVAVPKPEESEVKVIDPLEAQHGGDEGKDDAEAQAQAEREQEQQRVAEAQRLESQRAAEQEAAQRERERRAEEERLAQERQARELLERQRVADERAAQDRRAQELAEQQRLAQERAAQERLAQERAAQERVQQERLQQERLAQERLQQERLQQERLQQERLQQERLAQERLQRERQEQEQERLAQERAVRERQAREQADQERVAQQRAAQERQAREQAERERLAQQRAPQVPDDPFALGPGAGGAGGGTGQGTGGAGQRIPRDLAGPDLKDRARELVKGLDLLRGTPPPVASSGNRRVVVGAAERDVPLRLYVDSWRMKIERTGAVHYPKSWASAGGADPLVNVAVRSDGTVEDVTIIRSSGRPDMDDRVRQIVRLNARYAQFPPNIASRYDVIDIRRIWRFDDVLKLIEELP